MNIKGLILDIDKFSTHDGPGIRSAIFLKGCPLSCRWCHSPESQSWSEELLYQRMRCSGCGACGLACAQKAVSWGDKNTGIIIRRDACIKCFNCVKACPSKAMRICGTEYTAEELAESIKPDIPFFKNSGGGLTLTGGEPLAQPHFTFEFLSLCRDLGIHIIMETCGFGPWDDLKKIATLCSEIYFDIKLLDPVQHEHWTAVSNIIIHENLHKLCDFEKFNEKITIRVPCIPGLNDSIEYIRKIACFTAAHNIQKIQLLPYNMMAAEKYSWIGRTYPMEKITVRDKNYYQELNRVAEAEGLTAL